MNLGQTFRFRDDHAESSQRFVAVGQELPGAMTKAEVHGSKLMAPAFGRTLLKWSEVKKRCEYLSVSNVRAILFSCV